MRDYKTQFYAKQALNFVSKQALTLGGAMLSSLYAPHRPPTLTPRGGHRYHRRHGSIDSFSISRSQRKWKRKRHFFFILSSSSSSGVADQEDQGGQGGDEQQQQQQQRRKPQCLLVEKYQDGTAKSYTLDGNSLRQAMKGDHGSSINILQKDNLSFSHLSWLPSALREFILPVGFPGSVSDDYLDYMLFQLPTNVTGWICHTLVTSTLLKAVGVGSFTGTSAAASAAAIRWVSKDGLGAIGRLFIGGRFGNLFDDDPKQWRMYADLIGSAGSIFELITPLYTEYFLPLASLGNLTKAVARGLKDPSFRVIQSHFAISGNLGEVAAKEEVWEVTAQLLGLAVGILIMDTPGTQTSYEMLAFAWLSFRILHLWLRYQSISVLRFRTINLKRARVLVKSHILHHSVPGYVDCNKEENIMTWERFLQPRVTFAVSMDKMIGGEGAAHMVKALLKLYTGQKYILFVNQKGSEAADYMVTFKVGATSLSALKSLWHVHWLHEHPRQGPDHVLSWLEGSLPKVEEGFSDFLRQLESAGWEKHQITLKVAQDILFHEVESLDIVNPDE